MREAYEWWLRKLLVVVYSIKTVDEIFRGRDRWSRILRGFAKLRIILKLIVKVSWALEEVVYYVYAVTIGFRANYQERHESYVGLRANYQEKHDITIGDRGLYQDKADIYLGFAGLYQE